MFWCQKAFDPMLLFKPQDEKSTTHTTLPTEGFVLVIQTQFEQELLQSTATRFFVLMPLTAPMLIAFKL